MSELETKIKEKKDLIKKLKNELEAEEDILKRLENSVSHNVDQYAGKYFLVNRDLLYHDTVYVKIDSCFIDERNTLHIKGAAWSYTIQRVVSTVTFQHGMIVPAFWRLEDLEEVTKEKYDEFVEICMRYMKND